MSLLLLIKFEVHKQTFEMKCIVYLPSFHKRETLETRHKTTEPFFTANLKYYQK